MIEEQPTMAERNALMWPNEKGPPERNTDVSVGSTPEELRAKLPDLEDWELPKMWKALAGQEPKRKIVVEEMGRRGMND